jgi:hypothetical protein
MPLIQRLSPPEERPPKDNIGRMTDSAQFVQNMEESLNFYKELELKVLSDNVFPEGAVDEVLHLPAGTRTRIGI